MSLQQASQKGSGLRNEHKKFIYVHRRMWMGRKKVCGISHRCVVAERKYDLKDLEI